MVDANKTSLEGKSLGMPKVILGSFLAVAIVVFITIQVGQTKTNESVEASVSKLASQCSSASLISGPTSNQLSCLMDVKAEYGTFDCQAAKGFETRLKADVELCEAKIGACLSDKPAIQLDASAQEPTKRKSTMIVKREPAKLSQLGRSQSPSETSSYFIQCDNTEGHAKLVQN